MTPSVPSEVEQGAALTLGLGSMEPAGSVQALPAGSLTLSDPRELLVSRSIRGGYGPDGTLDPDTLRLWGYGEEERPDQVPDRLPDGEVVSVVEEEVIWGGAMSAHFGHFLTESVSRLWPFATGECDEGTPVVFTTPTARSFSADWLQAFGVDVVPLPDGIVRFRRVRIPQSAWRIDTWVAPEIRTIHLRAREGMRVPKRERAQLRWFSRSKIELARRVRDECMLEWLLGDRVDLIRMETLTLAEQVAAIEASEAIAGTVGSAFHTLLLARDLPQTLYFCTDRVASTFLAQDAALGTASSYVHTLASESMELARAGGRRRYRVLVPETLRALDGTVAPGLLEDRRLAELSRPELPAVKVIEGSQAKDLDAKVRHVLLDSNSINARMYLGAAFEEEGLLDCALEQFLYVADLTDGYAYGPLRAARLLAGMGEAQQAAVLAQRVLDMDPNSEEAARYAAL